MKMKMGLCLMAMVILVAAAMAQPSPPVHHRGAEERVKYVSERFERELKLSVSQKEKMAAHYREFFAEMGKLHSKEDAPPPPPMPPANKEAAEKLSKARDQKIKTVLNAEQYQQYITLEKKMRPPHPPNKPGAPKRDVTDKNKPYGY